MIYLLLWVMVNAQLILSLFQPTLLVYIALLTGPIPLVPGSEGSFSSPFGRMDITSVRVFGLLLSSCIVLLFHLEKVGRYIKIYRFHLFFLLFCIGALGWSPSLVYGIRMILKLSSVFLFFLLFMIVISSKKHLVLVERLMLLSGIFVLIISITTKFAGINPDPRLTIPFVSPAVFTSHLVTVGMLALANAKHGKSVKSLFLVICFSAAVLAGFTRITIAALFVGFSVMLFLSSRGTPRVILPAAGIAGLPALFFLNDTFKKRMFFGADKMTLSGAVEDPSMAYENLAGSGRFAAWDYVLEHFFEPNPFIGSGIGATQHYFYTYSPTGLGVVHSEYIRLISEVGLAGLALFIAAMLIYLFRMVHACGTRSGGDIPKYALAAVGGLVSYLIFMATDNALDYVSALGIYVFALIGMAEKAMELETAAKRAIPFSGDETAKDVDEKTRNRRYPIIYSDRNKVRAFRKA